MNSKKQSILQRCQGNQVVSKVGDETRVHGSDPFTAPFSETIGKKSGHVVLLHQVIAHSG